MSQFKLSVCWRLILSTVVLLLAPSMVFAQGTGTISGTIADSTGVPIPNARITVDGATKATTSGSTGEFTLTGMAAGTYTIRARLIGFREQSQPVTVTAGQMSSVQIGRASCRGRGGG